MRLLAVYNICGIGGFQNHVYYGDAIRSVLKQKGFEPGELTLAVSSCCSLDYVRYDLTRIFENSITFNWIGDSIPLTVSFNHTVKKCVEHFGKFDGYLYLDSGINFHDPMHRYDALKPFWDEFKRGDWGMLAAMPINDDGRSWWNITYPESGTYQYGPAETTNLHCQIYSEALREAYDGKLHCDIFSNDTSESVSFYICSAIKKKFGMYLDIEVFHNTSMDGASVGWRGGDGPRKRLFQTEKTMDERYIEGQPYGFGYEECAGNVLWTHDPEKFGPDKMALDDRLYPFLKKELFLSKEEFDYDTISHHFIPEGK